MKRACLVLIITLILLATSINTSNTGGFFEQQPDVDAIDDSVLSSDPAVLVDASPYFVLELSGGNIPKRGSAWSQLLNSSGIVSRVVDVSDVIVDTMLLDEAPAIIADASIGSNDGTMVSQILIDLLVQKDIPLVLTGRSAWILHRLRGEGPPSLTAPATVVLLETAEYAGAVFMSSPIPLTVGMQMTTETGVTIPKDQTQTEMSRLVDLTGASPTSIASLRFDSYPLDVFLFSAENPTLLTGTGQGLLQNTIAFSSALRETETGVVISDLQAPEGSLLAGGFSYVHEPTIAEAYYAVYSANALLSGSSWTAWVSENSVRVQSVLEALIVDLGPETGFMTSRSDGIVNCRSTGQGLWLIGTMALTGSFNVPEIVNYLSSHQDIDGGFENSIISTHHVTEALYQSGNLGTINIADLENWLRSLVIDGTKTSDPDLWGAVAANPTSLSPTNDYAIKYLRSLRFLGKAHPDPAKLTSWILTRTALGDGSFKNSHNPDDEIITGTASALASMEILGTLSSSNRTSGITWLANNQLDSGGFGMKPKPADLVAKIRESSRVAGCLEELSETGGVLATNIISFIASITTDVGFETMDILPSLMWSSWLLRINRLAHASDLVDLAAAVQYINYFEKCNIWPLWDNITTIIPPDYGWNQYRTISVWSQYFAALLADSLGVALSADVQTEMIQFLSQAQWVTGHYRPATMSGTAHMQHSVAAVETLYLLDALDTIPYRTSLESAILSEYSSGTWDLTGWTLAPFAGSQEAVDFFSTRAALRLDIVSPAMASQITAALEARVQYTDLLALSYDVATLSLLNTSAFSTDLESIDRSSVLGALGSHFTTGWYNTTTLRQPIFTQSVLRMISILGLRSRMNDVSGNTLAASTEATPAPGVYLPISITIKSASSSHSVLVYSFGEWHLFTGVANEDTLMLPVPSTAEILGPTEITLSVVDWGESRAFDSLSFTVRGTILGSLDLETPTIKMGETVNGTAVWFLAEGIDAGECQVKISLGVQEWTYDESSPYWFSVSTTGLDAGTYPLTVIVERPFCTDLVLIDEVVIAQPNPTFLVSSSSLSGIVGEELLLSWSLHFSSNSSQIAGQEVTLTLRNSLDVVVFTEVGVSRIGGSTFSWTPTVRDVYDYTLIFPGNYSLEGTQSSGVITVSEHTLLSWSGVGTDYQYSEASIDILLETLLGEALAGQMVHLTVTAPSMAIVHDSNLVTNSTGYLSFTFALSENGVYLLQAGFSGSGLLLGSSDSESVISWSSTVLEVGGVSVEVRVGDTCSLWAKLRDSQLIPIPGQILTVRIILFPSTVVLQQSRTTNSSGVVSVTWIANSAGAYRFEASYAGTLSRGAAGDSIDFDVLIPVTLTTTLSPNYEVGTENWIEVSATDNLAELISGLTIIVEIRGPENELLFTDSVVTSITPIVISWTPSVRGTNTITVSSSKQLWYEAATEVTTQDVFETPSISIILPSDAVAPTVRDLVVSVVDTSLTPVIGATVHCLVTLNDTIIHDAVHATTASGTITLSLSLNTPGVLMLDATLEAQSWLRETSKQESVTVFAETTLTIMTPGQPVKQGSTVGVVITLLDWSGAPMRGAQIEVNITWSNGTVIRSLNRLTDEFGKCTIAQQFLVVGDFIIRATFAGYGLNGSATDSVPQRVYVTPIIEVVHDPSCIVGDTLEIQVAYRDALGAFIIGRTISVTIQQNGATVFETQVSSASGLVSIDWDPSAGGLATITILHSGNVYYLTNSTSTTASVLEHVTGELWLTPSQVDLFDSSTFVYNLTSGLRVGITIHFEVLGMDLVPVWSADITTNSSGMATVVYTALESHGILRVNAGPTLDQFLIGGDIQKLLIVKTHCVVDTSLIPPPPTADTITQIMIWIEDELVVPIDDLKVTVSLYDPYGEQIKLGQFTMSVSVTVVEGTASATFTPEMPGLYTLIVSSSGASSVHSFLDTSYHTIYSRTQLLTVVSSHVLEVGDTLEVTSRLTDYVGNPLVGRTLTLTVDGPGVNFIGPITLVTNATGHIEWSSTLDDEGLWVLEVSFNGLGVYLPIDTRGDISVRYGTVIELSLIDSGTIIAGTTPASLSILLRDTGGTPLEGFTVQYEAHHETLGLTLQGNLIQTGSEPMVLNITLGRMGNYTIIVSFAGTTHYHATNAALQLWVLGRTEVSAEMPAEIDRAQFSLIPISILDELDSPIPLSELDFLLELTGPAGSVNLTDHLSRDLMSVSFMTQGLQVGFYTLNVTVDRSDVRVGCIALFEFSIVSITHIELAAEDLTGVISTSHSFSFILVDSLSATIEGATVWVSLFNPSGREIYGSPLTDRTAVTSNVEGSDISWTPSITGEYRVVLQFDGDSFLNGSSLEFVILVRYPSSLEVELPESIPFGEIVPLSISLNGVIGKISGATIVITVFMGSNVELEETVITDNHGMVSFNLIGLLSGIHNVTVSFAGSAAQAPRLIEESFVVTAVVVLKIESTSDVYLGHYCSVNMSVTVLGTTPDWTGTIKVRLTDPYGEPAGQWTFDLGVYTVVTIGFNAQIEGMHTLNITINGLPIINSQEYPMVVTVVNEIIQLQLDAGTTPLIGGLGILAAVGVVLRKKIHEIIGSFPREWSS